MEEMDELIAEAARRRTTAEEADRELIVAEERAREASREASEADMALRERVERAINAHRRGGA